MNITTSQGTMILEDDAKPSTDDMNNIIDSLTNDSKEFQSLCDASTAFPADLTAALFSARCAEWLAANRLAEAFATLKSKDRPCFFAESPEEMCEAERRRLFALSNGSLDKEASIMLAQFPRTQPVSVFEFDRENALEKYEDGSLYVKSSADSEVWADAGDYYVEVVAEAENPEPGLLAFFGKEE